MLSRTGHAVSNELSAGHSYLLDEVHVRPAALGYTFSVLMEHCGPVVGSIIVFVPWFCREEMRVQSLQSISEPVQPILFTLILRSKPVESAKQMNAREQGFSSLAPCMHGIPFLHFE